MHNMSHENEKKDDDNNNTNNNHILQQQQTIIRDHSRTKEKERSLRTREQQSPTNNKMRDM